jgi:hypothetical protein
MLAPTLLALTVTATLTGFEAPESAFWDSATRSWFVSNVAGEPGEKDGKGWISRLDAEGRLVKDVWVDGFNAPKGLRAAGNLLFVADLDEVAVVDIAKAQVTERLKAPGAQFLNDVEVGPGGEAYVSDMMTNTIYRCVPGKDCEAWLKSEALENPNGLLLDGGKLVVAAWGVITDPATFGTRTPGRLLEVDLKTKAVKPLGDGKPQGNLDGIEKDGSDYLVTDWVAGKLLRITRKGAVTVLKDGLKNAADLGYDAKARRAVLPDMGAGTVLVLQISR